MIRGGYIQKRIYAEWKVGPKMFIQSQIILVAPPSQIQRPCESSFNEEGHGHNTCLADTKTKQKANTSGNMGKRCTSTTTGKSSTER